MILFERKRIYSNQSAILKEAQFDERKERIGSDRVVALPKYEKPEVAKWSAGVYNLVKMMLP